MIIRLTCGYGARLRNGCKQAQSGLPASRPSRLSPRRNRAETPCNPIDERSGLGGLKSPRWNNGVHASLALHHPSAKERYQRPVRELAANQPIGTHHDSESADSRGHECLGIVGDERTLYAHGDASPLSVYEGPIRMEREAGKSQAGMTAKILGVCWCAATLDC
jgi:hypothetical protein